MRIAFGTNTSLYVMIDGTLSDITPDAFTPGLADSEYVGGGGA